MHLHAQSSILHEGSWYKMAIGKEGVYTINYDLLKKMGIDPSQIDPKKIKIYGNEGGMLPQGNNASRPSDLTELSIYVKGEEDNIFNTSDIILFYAQGPDRCFYNESRNTFYYEKNLYSDENYYFFTFSGEPGKRIEASENIEGNFPIVNTFNDYVYHETDKYNDLRSGRQWLGERFLGNSKVDLKFQIEGVVPSSSIQFISDVVGKSSSASSFTLTFNGTTIGQQYILPVSLEPYSIIGHHDHDTITVNADLVAAQGRSVQDISYSYVPQTNGTGYLDFLLIQCERQLSLYGNQTIFQSVHSTVNEISQFEIANASGVTVWDITNHDVPKNQTFATQGNKAVFSTPTATLRKFIVFNSSFLLPQFVEKINNQNLHGLATPNLIIVSHPTLLSEAHRLASHRQQHSGWTAEVVSTDQVYNEFSSGRQDITAIRDFVKHLYDKSPGTLKSLLLFGRCSYDYKNRVDRNTNLVPTYESYNSLSPLETYSSDDYFGFLEDTEGEWAESGSTEDHTLDIGVGRLPVKTIEEASAIVNKIIEYDTNKKALGGWRKKILFVADDGSLSDGFTSLHQSQANVLAEKSEETNPEFDSRKIFLGTYQKQIGPSGESIPKANKDIIENFDRGTLIINYTGHGGEKLWADEKVFSDFDIEVLKNKLYPFLVTATCEFGRHDDPWNISGAELSIIKDQGGSIGLLTSARPVNSGTNFELNKAFYNTLFEKEDNKHLTLGEIFRRTKNNSLTHVFNRNFSLLADPSLTLAFPSLKIEIEEIKTILGGDTLKALSTVTVKGTVKNDEGVVAENFNGTLEATLFDKKTDFVTIGKNKPPFSFKEWHNALFKGKASVKNGAFEFQFIVPKNISYQFNNGKISLYAYDTATYEDASGAFSSFVVGGSEESYTADHTSPSIKLFVGDTTFMNGGLSSSATTLMAHISDASGINISSYGIGNTMTALLDGGAESHFVNEYFESETDDFTKGWLRFPLTGLTAGKHSITLKAWDTHNNPAEATVEFFVTDGESVVIETFANYPNPFNEATTLFFTHNSAGDDLEVAVSVYDLRGKLLLSSEKLIQSSSYRVDVLELSKDNTGREKMMEGLYLARLIVRSLTNGSKNEKVTKLIVTN